MSTWLRSRRRRWTEFAFEAGLTLSGVAVVATPLLLWISWSETMFYGVLAFGAAGFIVFCSAAYGQQRFVPQADAHMAAGDRVPQVSRRTSAGSAALDELRPESLRPKLPDWERRDMHDPATYNVRRSGVREAWRSLAWTFGTAFSLMAAGGFLLFMLYLLMAG